MSWNKYSRSGLVLCVAGGLALSGCASGGWNRLIGKKDAPSAQLSLAWAKLKEEEGKLTDARAGYEKVLVEQPNNVDAMLGLARMNVKAQRLVEAEQGFEKALKASPKSPVVLSEVGQFYTSQQRWDKAIPLLQDAQRIEPHEKSHQFTLGVALTKAGRTSEALPHFTDAVGEAAAHYNVGRLLIETGKKGEAERQFKLALAKDPQLSDAQYFLDEIQTAGKAPTASEPIAAVPESTGAVAQQVSDTTATGKRVVTPAASQQPAGKTAPRPGAGYEELPPPPDGVDAASFSTQKPVTDSSDIIQMSGYTPAATDTPRSAPKLRLLPAPTASGNVAGTSVAP